MDAKTIEVSADEGLSLIQQILPILGAAVPVVGAAAGPIGMGLSAAMVLTPIIIRMIGRLANKNAITPAQQQDLLNKLADVLDFSGPQWQVSQLPPEAKQQSPGNPIPAAGSLSAATP